MKKCPKCGNPSYDGAPVCGNCGYNFPKPKVVAPKSEDIFQQEPKVEKESNDEDTISIIKSHKLLIGAIILITLIVICGIVLTGSNSNSNSPLQSGNNGMSYADGEFSFKYPDNWKEVNGSDETHPGAKFFQNDNNTTIEYYNVTSNADSVKEIAQSIITSAQGKGAYVELVETITLDGRNTSNIVLEDADGDYTRYVSMFSDGMTYVLKVNGDSMNTVTSEEVNSIINTADIA
ncbi:MAG: zinc ribbon domain-containing protein [Methanobrevibacter sp.]|uniref:PsbP-related protein n=1 Tax=Methanobrevibacter sp. TaxID=66852 RepID=UPI001B75E68C|nr:PsbP-related protein [Methanobrevibacter sp.]MBP3791786.1 zinc ribbon domain-containing protein [Methanobrevibacter sp.]